MKIYPPIQNVSFSAIIRIGLMLFMSIHISIGHLSEYLDCFEANEIELAEENDLESEEKKVKEEIEKDEFLNRLFFCAFSSHEKLHQYHGINAHWNISYGEVLTPPPRLTLV